MFQKKLFKTTILSLTCTLLLAGVPVIKGSAADTSTAVPSVQTKAEAGKWMTGEYHAHTYESDDAQQSLETVLDQAFDQYGLDWLGLSDHLRDSSRDDQGYTLSSKIPMSQGISRYQVPRIKALQGQGKYAGKIIFSGFEWDAPGFDHSGVGLVSDDPTSPETLKAIEQFEYLFSSRNANLFDPSDVAAWSAADSRAYSTKQDTQTALAWLKAHYPDSYLLINHPSRKKGASNEIKVEDLRNLNNLAPNIAFGFEGMLGNQMAPDRGETVDVYGGSDGMLAKVGGVWDALLGEGRHFWTFANSDFHFKISGDNKYSSGYFPGEYSKNYTWVDGSDMRAVVDGMRSGKSFSVFGDLINALDFQISGNGNKAETGGDLQVTQGDDLTLTIRFKSPASNNNGDTPQVDHVDLIAGDVTGPIDPSSADYTKATNDSTKVLKRFSKDEWTTDAEGYNVITYKLGAAKGNQYFRLRGTNLGENVPNETVNGEPQLDIKNTTADNETRFTEINDRNYSDLWFYSNPIFVDVTSYSDDQAVQDTAGALDLGDTSGVMDDLTLPMAGEHGTAIEWTSSNPELMDNSGKLLVRYPDQDTKLTLTASVKRGESSTEKPFTITVKGLNSIDAVKLYSVMNKADNTAYTASEWTNQTVTASVYTGEYTEPVTNAALEVSIDGGEYAPYTAYEPLSMTEQGSHSLSFRSTDNLGRHTTLTLPIWMDLTKPVVTLKGTKKVDVKLGSSYVEPGVDVMDAFGEVDPGSLAVTGSVDSSKVGIYELKYTAADKAGNVSAPVIRTVEVYQPSTPSEPGNSTPPPVQPGSGTNSGSNNGNNGNNSSNGKPQDSNHFLELDIEGDSPAAGEIKGIMNFTIPAGALALDGKIQTRVLEDNQAPSSAGMLRVSPVVEFTSNTGSTLVKPMKLSLNYDAGKLAPGQQAAVYYYNETQAKWIYLGGTAQTNGTVTVDMSRFAKTAVFGYTKKNMTDLSGHWSAPYADRLIGMNVIQGFEDGNFQPDQTVTRGQFAVMLAGALGLPSAGSSSAVKFTDSSSIPSWASAQVDAAVQSGILKGYKEADGTLTFKANQEITRAEMAVMIANALKYSAGSLPVAASGSFKDQNAIAAWAQTSIKEAVSAGILNGYEDGTFRPDQQATRGEAAAMTFKLLGALHL